MDTLRDEDFPSTFVATDKAAINAQKWFDYLHIGYYTSLVIIAVSVFFSSQLPKYSTFADSLAMTIMIGGIIFLSIIKIRRYDKKWFDCRSIAESVKTLSWRYMTKIKPFLDDNADTNFIKDIKELRSEKLHIVDMTSSALEITDKMKVIRALRFDEKKQVYISDRVQNQRKWYATKSISLEKKGNNYFWGIFVLQLLAIFASIFGWKEDVIKIAPLVFALVALLVSWSNLKRFDELGISYYSACTELVALENLLFGCASEKEFLQLVEETEEAISREHTMWIAKRGA